MADSASAFCAASMGWSAVSSILGIKKCPSLAAHCVAQEIASQRSGILASIARVPIATVSSCVTLIGIFDLAPEARIDDLIIQGHSQISERICSMTCPIVQRLCFDHLALIIIFSPIKRQSFNAAGTFVFVEPTAMQQHHDVADSIFNTVIRRALNNL